MEEIIPEKSSIQLPIISAQLPFLHLLLVVASDLCLLFRRRCHAQDYAEHEKEDVAYAQYEKYDCKRLHFNSFFLRANISIPF